MTKSQALRAVKARIDGRWDDPDLVAIGPLCESVAEDIVYILSLAKGA